MECISISDETSKRNLQLVAFACRYRYFEWTSSMWWSPSPSSSSCRVDNCRAKNIYYNCTASGPRRCTEMKKKQLRLIVVIRTSWKFLLFSFICRWRCSNSESIWSLSTLFRQFIQVQFAVCCILVTYSQLHICQISICIMIWLRVYCCCFVCSTSPTQYTVTPYAWCSSAFRYSLTQSVIRIQIQNRMQSSAIIRFCTVDVVVVVVSENEIHLCGIPM